ncbi:hypothetical protein N8878_04265 [Psychromonas sp.]|nr:hypothetical protein [Psychromonas sp.]
MINIKAATFLALATFGLAGCLDTALISDGTILETEEPISETEEPTSSLPIEAEFTSNNNWVHADQNKIQNEMTTTFLMRANAAGMDGFVGLSSAATDDFNSMLTSVRFAPSGQIDARDGNAYRADIEYDYIQGVWYEVTIDTSVISRLYSVSISEYGDSENTVELIKDASYRTGTDESAGITNLTLWSSDAGTIDIANLVWPESDSVEVTEPTIPTEPTTPTTEPTNPNPVSPTVYGEKCEVSEVNGKTFLQHHEFEWIIDGINHNAGAYITGDCWIKGPVQVVSVSPEPYANSNGSMANPAAGPDTGQGYEIGLAAYDANLRLDFPYAAAVNTSIVSSVTDPIFSGTNNRAGWIIAHGILTVTADAASESHFRPPYSDPDKEAYNYTFSDLSLSHIPRLATVSETPIADNIIAITSRPWVDHIFEYLSRGVHATENMPGYGGDLTSTVAGACLASTLDWPEEERSRLAANMVQIGIDNYGMVNVGHYFIANGGHNSGRLLPILYAGKALGNTDMLNVTSRDYPIEHGFAENCQTYGEGEYGIRHCTRGDDDTKYNSVNSPTWVGESLCARMIGVESNWNHAPFFNYVDNWVQSKGLGERYGAYDAFSAAMWEAYNSNY